MDQEQFQKWLWAEALRQGFDPSTSQWKTTKPTGLDPNMVKNQNQRRNQGKNQVPKWFQTIPKDAPKWVCKLHESIPIICNNPLAPSDFNKYCCPHVYETITKTENNNFIAFKVNNHEFIKPFDPEIALLIGSDIDPNKYELASANFDDFDYFTVAKFNIYKIIQPFTLTLQLAHKLGLVGSFARYDEIILNLAKQVGEKINQEHEKIFNRYEKCRDLALGTSELGEKANAMEMAYNQGRKLISQFRELLKPPKVEEDLDDQWFATLGGSKTCDSCYQITDVMYINRAKSTILCDYCRHNSQAPLRCDDCRQTASTLYNVKLYRNKQGKILCSNCIQTRPGFSFDFLLVV